MGGAIKKPHPLIRLSRPLTYPLCSHKANAKKMSYYLGKVGRAGARLVSSCKDLYNDVNAAYLTGAIDVIVVKQKDGTLKSTPFHVRFGKLGVLRTGDLKEVWHLGMIQALYS